MAKSNSSLRKRTNKQVIYNAPRFILVESYLTKKGEVAMAMATTPEQMEVVNRKYRKNRYKRNPECTHVVRIISHSKFI